MPNIGVGMADFRFGNVTIVYPISALSPMRISRTIRLSPITMLDELHQPVTVDIVEEAFDIGTKKAARSNGI